MVVNTPKHKPPRSIVVCFDFEVPEHCLLPERPWLLPWAILRRIRQIQYKLLDRPFHRWWSELERALSEVLELDIDQYLRSARLGLHQIADGQPASRGLEPLVGNLIKDLLRAEVQASRAMKGRMPSTHPIFQRLWGCERGDW